MAEENSIIYMGAQATDTNASCMSEYNTVREKESTATNPATLAIASTNTVQWSKKI
jgi:hypothetical protein